MILWVAGGRQGQPAGVADRDHRALYDRAVLARLDPATGEVLPVLEHQDADPAFSSGGPTHRFGAPSADGEGVLVCTERAVHRVDPLGRVVASWSHGWFADLHHVVRIGGAIHAVATGIDGVVVVDEGSDTRFVAVAAGVQAPPAGADRRTTRRRSPWHANHTFVVDGAQFVTRGVAGDAVPLGGGAAWPIADVVVHDGVVRPDGVWFTAVDGRLLRVDPGSGRVDRTIGLREPEDGEAPLGWCRGLVFDGDVAYVGFTRLRATRARRNLAWIARHLRGTAGPSARPTRIEAWDLRSGRRLGAWPTEAAGVDAAFGMVQAPA